MLCSWAHRQGWATGHRPRVSRREGQRAAAPARAQGTLKAHSEHSPRLVPRPLTALSPLPAQQHLGSPSLPARDLALPCPHGGSNRVTSWASTSAAALPSTTGPLAGVLQISRTQAHVSPWTTAGASHWSPAGPWVAMATGVTFVPSRSHLSPANASQSSAGATLFSHPDPAHPHRRAFAQTAPPRMLRRHHHRLPHSDPGGGGMRLRRRATARSPPSRGQPWENIVTLVSFF